MFVQPLAWCLPVSKLLGFSMSRQQKWLLLALFSHGYIAIVCSSEAYCHVGKVCSFMDRHTHIYALIHTLLHLADSLCWSPQTPDYMIYLSQQVSPFRVLQYHSSSSNTPANYNCYSQCRVQIFWIFFSKLITNLSWHLVAVLIKTCSRAVTRMLMFAVLFQIQHDVGIMNLNLNWEVVRSSSLFCSTCNRNNGFHCYNKQTVTDYLG